MCKFETIHENNAHVFCGLQQFLIHSDSIMGTVVEVSIRYKTQGITVRLLIKQYRCGNKNRRD